MKAKEKAAKKMGKIWEFFENLNEYVYVTDMDTYELVYMNKKIREQYGFRSMEELAGKRCYELLQGNSTPCAICNNEELTPGNFKEWNCYNPIIGKHVALKDTMIEEGGKRYRLEMAIDVSAQERQDRRIREYQNLETLANEGLRIALQAPTPDKSIEVILEYLGKALQGERTYVFERNECGGDDNTYEWVASGVTPEIDNLQDLPPEVCANWYRIFEENENVRIEDLEDIKEEDPLQYENLKRQDIHSLAVVSLRNEGKVIGFYGVDNPPGESLDYAQDMLDIMGYFIVSCLKRRNLIKELKNMSHTDQLTGVGNRRAMYEYLEKMKTNTGVAVVYCDVTGLKRTNDTKGHVAGDELLLRACQCLRNVFPMEGLFRVGGDEFVALIPNISEQELSDRLQCLREELQKNQVAMAVGTAQHTGGRQQIEEALAEAEKQMYMDKTAYYEKMGMDRRRV